MKFLAVAALFAAVVVADHHLPGEAPEVGGGAPPAKPPAPAPKPATPAPAPAMNKPMEKPADVPAGDAYGSSYTTSSYSTYATDYATSSYDASYTSSCYSVKTISTDYTTVIPTVIYETVSDCAAPTYPAGSTYPAAPTPTYYQAGAGANAVPALVAAVAGLAAIAL